MGNCITRKPNILSEDDNNRLEPNKQLEKTAAAAEVVGLSTSTFRAADYDDEDRKKEVKRSVRFRLGEEEKGRKGQGGVVRVKLVLTQKELDRILNGGDDQDKHSSAERLWMKTMIIMRSRRGRSSEEYRNYYQWKPALESIHEEII